jgi:hypothetical protein
MMRRIGRQRQHKSSMFKFLFMENRGGRREWACKDCEQSGECPAYGRGSQLVRFADDARLVVGPLLRRHLSWTWKDIVGHPAHQRLLRGTGDARARQGSFTPRQ